MTVSRREEQILEFKGFLSFFILHELKQQPLYGEQLARRIGKRRGEKLTPGTIYPALKRLRKEKLVTFTQDGQRKVYRISDAGAQELKRLYRLFGQYFKGLRERIPAVPRGRTGVKKRISRRRSG